MTYTIQYRLPKDVKKCKDRWHVITTSEEKREAIKEAQETITTGEVRVIDEQFNLVYFR
jgi:hypothetical protein